MTVVSMGEFNQTQAPTPDLEARIAVLEKAMIVPAELVVKDAALAYQQTSAIRKLAMLRTPAATAAIARFLLLPESIYFADGMTPDGVEWHSVSYQAMYYLHQTVEGVPPPTNGTNFTKHDLNQIREWWIRSQHQIRFKELADK